MRKRLFLGLPAGLLLGAGTASAQFNDQWIAFNESPSTLGVAGSTISNANTEVDFDWADMDQDGDVDMAIVRKEPFTSAGKRTNLLMRNDNGVLNDITATHATASDVPGDQGFNTPTNDRDVIFIDLDNDGDLEMVTATTLSDNDPKHIGHPRVYVNLGELGTGGSWAGYRHEDGRIPQMLHFGNGLPRNPRFCSVDGGDMTGDGFADLYFGDYDSSGAGGVGQPSNFDMNDRLLINDGSGHFVDESQSRMTSQMLLSAFSTSVVVIDINMDGVMDVIKDTALQAPQYVAVAYNNPNNEGVFNIFDDFHTNAPYHINTGDLNNDGREDIVITDDGDDRYRLNLGVDPLGRVTWSAAKTFDFVDGDDDGFGSNNLVVDLDGDGWNDVFIADVDVDIGGCGRRLHIYHNETTTPGTTNTVLIEEREQEVTGGGFFGGGTEDGWIGVVGLEDDDLEGVHDMAVFDIDGDGDMDMVLGRCNGTFAWLSGDPLPPCGPRPYGENAAPANVISAIPGGGSQPGTTFEIAFGNVNAASAVVVMSAGIDNLPAGDGMILVDTASIALLSSIDTSTGAGLYSLPLPSSADIVGATAYFQAATLDAAQSGGIAYSDGVLLTVCPQ